MLDEAEERLVGLRHLCLGGEADCSSNTTGMATVDMAMVVAPLGILWPLDHSTAPNSLCLIKCLYR